MASRLPKVLRRRNHPELDQIRTLPGYFDIALRDFGLLVGAVTLARLATRYAPGQRTS